MLAHTNDDEGTGKYAKMVELVKNHLINLQHTHTDTTITTIFVCFAGKVIAKRATGCELARGQVEGKRQEEYRLYRVEQLVRIDVVALT